MFKALIGDLFASRAQTLVNTINCVGVMGKGVALEFKKRFPDVFDDYAARCERKEVRLGEPYLYRSAAGTGGNIPACAARGRGTIAWRGRLRGAISASRTGAARATRTGPALIRPVQPPRLSTRSLFTSVVRLKSDGTLLVGT